MARPRKNRGEDFKKFTLTLTASKELFDWIEAVSESTSTHRSFHLRKGLELYLMKQYPDKMPEGYNPLP